MASSSKTNPSHANGGVGGNNNNNNNNTAALSSTSEGKVSHAASLENAKHDLLAHSESRFTGLDLQTGTLRNNLKAGVL